MKYIEGDIQNRPGELWELPHYGHMPKTPFRIELKYSIGEFLSNDIFDLDGNQPVESKFFQATGGVIEVNPSKDVIDIYKKRGDIFQMINVVVCCYAFEEIDGTLTGLPYHISLRPAQKHGEPASVDPEWI